MKQCQTKRLQERLEDFMDLQQLSRICQVPVVKRASLRPDPRQFVESLQKVYAADIVDDDPVHRRALLEIPPVGASEVLSSLQKMHKGKCSDRHNVMIEMFLYGGSALHQYLACIYTRTTQSGDFPLEWQELMFTMLPKQGDPLEPGNWRPIVILDVAYKIFAKILHGRFPHSRG